MVIIIIIQSVSCKFTLFLGIAENFLPSDILKAVCVQIVNEIPLNTRDVVSTLWSIMRVCKHWHMTLTEEDANYVWRNLSIALWHVGNLHIRDWAGFAQHRYIS